MFLSRWGLSCWLIVGLGSSVLAPHRVYGQSSMAAIKTLQQLDASDASSELGASVLKSLSAEKEPTAIQVLGAMKGATPIGKNWLAGLASARRQKLGVPSAQLKQFIDDASNDGEARYLAFDWLTQSDPEARQRMLPTFQNDASLELRFVSIANELSGDAERSPDQLKSLLAAARHPNQVVDIIARLKKADVEIDQAKHFAFLQSWRLIGPFDHVGSKNFDKEFDVERDYLKGNLQPSYQGKADTVTWRDETTASVEGAFDLAKIYDREKGCIVYAYTTYRSDKELEAELRLGCINANKVWFNDQLVISNEVYHTSQQIDQYSAPIKIRAGENEILLKVCQNEQKEQWAQDFSFQVRISDATGKGILSQGETK